MQWSASLFLFRVRVVFAFRMHMPSQSRVSLLSTAKVSSCDPILTVGRSLVQWFAPIALFHVPTVRCILDAQSRITLPHIDKSALLSKAARSELRSQPHVPYQASLLPVTKYYLVRQ